MIPRNSSSFSLRERKCSHVLHSLKKMRQQILGTYIIGQSINNKKSKINDLKPIISVHAHFQDILINQYADIY